MSLVQPNLNADIYRNMSAADRPPIFDTHLQCISIYNETSALLGGSNLTDRYWSGTVWYYNNITDFDRNKAHLAKRIESGVCDAIFLESDKFVVGEDIGTLQVLDLVVAPNGLQELHYVGHATLHDSSITRLSAFANKKHIVSGGMDLCIKVWDISELMAMQSFDFAHTHIVTCVDVKPGSDAEFVSTSLDCEALLWDIRLPKPAQRILVRNAGLTTANWNPNAPNIVAIGTDEGEVIIVDVRKGGAEALRESCSFIRPVHKLLFNPNSERKEELAGCSDDTCVKVLDINSQISPIYVDSRHSDFVRGLTWYENSLYSCAWDNTVLKHEVNNVKQLHDYA